MLSEASRQKPSAGLLRLPLALPTTRLSLLASAASVVRDRLYVCLQGDWDTLSIDQLLKRLAFVYQQAAQAQATLDVRVLLPCADYDVAPGAPEIEALFGSGSEEAELDRINERRTAMGLASLVFVELPPGPLPADVELQRNVAVAADDTGAAKTLVRHAVVGGTFDYMHVGHKLLLSLSAYISSERLVCGVSDAPLLKKKAFRELMQPTHLRMALVEDFLQSIKPGLVVDLSALQDGYGPAITDPALEAIVVSTETYKGGEACNIKRRERSMRDMMLVTMPLVDEGSAQGVEVVEENKVSSTQKRRQCLGGLRGGETHWCRCTAVDTPYVVGLTGGIASGKSTARRIIAEIAAADSGIHAKVVTLDCDALAHQTYLPNTPTFEALVHAFGSGIVSTEAGHEGTINRKALGEIVFSDPECMKKLCDITWPATAEMAKSKIAASGADLIVMEAAVLLEAGWDDFVDEIWVVSAPHATVLARLEERNGISAEAAERRISAQMSSQDRFARCHVPLSSAVGISEMREDLSLVLQAAWRRATLGLASSPHGSTAHLFHGLCDAAKVDFAVQVRWWRKLRDAYCIGRHLYNMDLIDDMQARAAELNSKGMLADYHAVAYAIFFHRIIFDPAADDNEAKSASIWNSFAAECSSLTEQTKRAVSGYIERPSALSEAPAPVGDFAHFQDCLRAVMGRSEVNYSKHLKALRLEYANLPPAEFARQRKATLQSLLGLPTIFRGDKAAVIELEAQARKNMEAEIMRLSRFAP